MRRLISILLVLLLAAGLASCQAVPSARESVYDLPIVTQEKTSPGAPETTVSAPITQAATEPGESTDAPTAEPVQSTEVRIETEPAQTAEPDLTVAEDGVYDSKEEVALYIHLYGHLPANYITKKEAEKLGWPGGELEPYAPGKCIGGSRFGNYEGRLPEAKGRTWTECDIDTLGAKSRGAKRIVFSNDGLIYYTEDHYEHFELLYGEEG